MVRVSVTYARTLLKEGAKSDLSVTVYFSFQNPEIL